MLGFWKEGFAVAGLEARGWIGEIIGVMWSDVTVGLETGLCDCGRKIKVVVVFCACMLVF